MGKKYNCDQKKCGYLQIGGGCRACDDCGTEPFILDDVCHTCWNCSRDEGILRWDNKTNSDENTQEEKKKEEEKKQEKEILVEEKA